MQAGHVLDVSVIIPVLNGAATIGDQLQALSIQEDAPSFEVLVCDNGSTDSTRRVVSEYSHLLPSLRIIDADGRPGPAHARNRGIEQAVGRILAFCDADDVVASDWLSQIARHARAGALSAGWTELGLLNPDVPYEGDGISRDLILRAGYLYSVDTANLAAFRDDVLNLRGFDESFRYVEDVDFAWRAQQIGITVESIPAIVHTRFRETARGAYRQKQNWSRFGIRLHAMNAHLAPMPMSFRYSLTNLIRTAVSLPVTWPRAGAQERRRIAGTLGALVGEVKAHIWYRLLKRGLGRELLPAQPTSSRV